MLVHVRAQLLDESAVGSLRLSVRLRVERGAALELRAHGRPQVLPEARGEARVAVADDLPRRVVVRQHEAIEQRECVLR